MVSRDGVGKSHGAQLCHDVADVRDAASHPANQGGDLSEVTVLAHLMFKVYGVRLISRRHDRRHLCLLESGALRRCLW